MSSKNEKKTGRTPRYLYHRPDGSIDLYDTQAAVLAEIDACEDTTDPRVYRVGRFERLRLSMSLTAGE